MKDCKKKCTKEQICNYETGRCVLRSGNRGKKILRERTFANVPLGKQSPVRKTPRKSPKRRASPRMDSDKCKNKICSYGGVCNPKTGRCVLKSGRVGKKIGRASPRRASPRRASPRRASPRKAKKTCEDLKCPTGKICNPVSMRCVKKDGKIGQKLLRKSPLRKSPLRSSPWSSPHLRQKVTSPLRSRKSPLRATPWTSPKLRSTSSVPVGVPASSVPVGVPASSVPVGVPPVGIPYIFSKVAEDCSINKLWTKDEKLGSGAYGAVYKSCKSLEPTDCDYVLKEQEANYEFYQEVRALSSLQGFVHVPKLYAAWTCNGNGYFIIEKLEKCKDLNYNKIKNILKKLEDKGWLHIDSHRGNFMCRPGTNDIIIIDFGWATTKDDNFALHELHNRGYFNIRKEDEDLLKSNKEVKNLVWEMMKLIQNYNIARVFNEPTGVIIKLNTKINKKQIELNDLVKKEKEKAKKK